MLNPIGTSHESQIISFVQKKFINCLKPLFNPKYIQLPHRTNLRSSFGEFAAETPTRFAYLSNCCIVFDKPVYLIHEGRCPQTKLSLETWLLFAHCLCWSFHLVETFLDLIIWQLEQVLGSDVFLFPGQVACSCSWPDGSHIDGWSPAEPSSDFREEAGLALA